MERVLPRRMSAPSPCPAGMWPAELPTKSRGADGEIIEGVEAGESPRGEPGDFAKGRKIS